MPLGKRSRRGRSTRSVKRAKFARALKRRVYGPSRLQRYVRAAVMATSETKYTVQTKENANLMHNGGQNVGGVFGWPVIVNLLATSQGNTQTTRVGDNVFGKLLSVKCWLSNKSDRPNVMYRIFVLACPPNAYTGDILNNSNVWRGETGNRIIDSVNTDKYKILYHRIVRPGGNDYSLEPSATLKEKSTFIKFAIPLRGRMIKYQTDGSQLPTYQNNILSLFIIPYDATGTLTTDNIASCSVISKFYFKDA